MRWGMPVRSGKPMVVPLSDSVLPSRSLSTLAKPRSAQRHGPVPVLQRWRDGHLHGVGPGGDDAVFVQPRRLAELADHQRF